MSHFLVMVAGKNFEKLLEPYNENLVVEEYSNTLSEDQKASFVEYYFPEEQGKDFEEVYVEKGKDWNNNSWRKEDGVWKEFSSYNHNSRWDWYCVGGRWSEYIESIGFSNKEPIKSNINFDNLLKKTSERASARWTKAIDCFNQNRGDQPFKTWKEVLNIPDIDIAKKREIYNSQPEVKAFCRLEGPFDLLDEYLVSKENYIEKAKKEIILPHAFLSEKTGWIERGSMGWFGLSSEDKETSDWYDEFIAFFNSLPEDEEIHFIDCHI